MVFFSFLSTFIHIFTFSIIVISEEKLLLFLNQDSFCNSIRLDTKIVQNFTK